MKWKRKMLWIWVVTLSLLFQSACAGVLGLDEALTSYLDLNHEVRFSCGIEAKTLIPFGKETLEKLNAMLAHVSMDATLLTDEEGTASTLQISAADQNVLDLTERQSTSGSTLQTSLLPNRTLTSSGSAMDALSGNPAAQEKSFDALRAISELQSCYQALTDGIAPFAEEKKASYKIKGIGSSRWSRIARLTAEQSAQLSPLIAEVLCCGMDEAYAALLQGMTYQKGFVIALYQEAQGGADMAVYMKGNVTMADGSTRKLSYQWAFANEDGGREDTYKFELLTTQRPKDNRTIAAAYTQKQLPESFLLEGSSETVLKTADETVTTTCKHDLSGQEEAGVRSLTGTLSTSVNAATTNESVTTTTTLSPDLKLTSAEGSGVLSGTMNLHEKEGGNVIKEILLTFDDEPAQMLTAEAASGALFAVSDLPESTPMPLPESSLIQNAEVLDSQDNAFLVGENPIGMTSYPVPAQMLAVNLDKATQEQKTALLNELSQNLATRLILAVAKLPAQDIALLTDGLTDADAATLASMLQGL
ncbi:MAG: hypothetical protein RR821_03215 [Clostridia bacterium]